MLTYTKGNLLHAGAEALVNTVNTVGVMGKGVALMFRDTFPENFRAYEVACKAGEVQTGRMFVTESQALAGPRWIVNFPTKQHWRQPSRMEWVTEGLKDLRRVITEKQMRSVALPPLGCGNGGLDWDEVRPEIEKALADLQDVEVIVYEPSSAYQNVAKQVGVSKLTPARALVAEAVRRYWILGIECTNLEVQKLGWFLERSVAALSLPNPLDLRFTADKYGPYSDRLRHLLDGLDGSYLHCAKRLSDAGPMDIIWFDDAQRARVGEYLQSDEALMYAPALEAMSATIDGFESPLGMELLATVDWLLQEKHCEPTVSGIKAGLDAWPAGTAAAKRKARLFDDRLIGIALRRLAH